MKGWALWGKVKESPEDGQVFWEGVWDFQQDGHGENWKVRFFQQDGQDLKKTAIRVRGCFGVILGVGAGW